MGPPAGSWDTRRSGPRAHSLAYSIVGTTACQGDGDDASAMVVARGAAWLGDPALVAGDRPLVPAATTILIVGGLSEPPIFLPVMFRKRWFLVRCHSAMAESYPRLTGG